MSGELAAGVLDQLREPDRRTISSWAVGNVTLPHSKRAREWREDTAYWLVEPLNAIQANEAVSLCKPTQTGGTTLYEVFLCWLLANAPADAALMGQTDEDAKYLWRSKLLPTLKASPATAPLVAAAKRWAITTTEAAFGPMTVRIHGPSVNSMQSASVEVLLLDEAWLFAPGTILELRERTSTREATRKIITVSQAGEEKKDRNGQPVWDEWGAWWHAGTQEVYQVVCPHCGSRFEPATEHFRADPAARDATTRQWDWTAVRRTVHLETPCCKRIIPNSPAGRRALSATGKYFATNPNPTPRHRSFRYSSWVVYWQDWGSLLEQFLRAQDARRMGDIEPLRIWTQKKEARWWRIKDTELPSFKERKVFGYTMAALAGGETPEDTLERLMLVDMQAACWKVLVRDFRQGGASRLVFQGEAKTWGEVAQLQTRYRVKKLRVGVDAQNWTQEVYRECAARGWVALHGSHSKGWQHPKITAQPPFSPPRRGRVAVATPSASGGRPSARGASACYFYEWSNLYFKDWLSRLVAGVGLDWEYADDVSDEYVQSLDSEARKIGADGKPLWVKIGSRPNHFWDCECMALVLASIIPGIFAAAPEATDSPEPEPEPEAAVDQDAVA